MLSCRSLLVIIIFTLSLISFNTFSSVMISATNQMYNSLKELIKWSDVYIIHGDVALNKDRVDYFVNNLKEAVNVSLNFIYLIN